MSVRDQVEAELRKAIPAGWVLYPSGAAEADVIGKPTVVFTPTDIQSLPAAPRSTWLYTYIVTVITPNTDPAAPELDEYVELLIEAINGMRDSSGKPFATVRSAARRVWSDQNDCWDVTADVATSKKKESTTP